MAEVSDDHPAGADARRERPGLGARGTRTDPGGGLSQLIDRETILRVRQAIDRLPENFRAALVLCEYENMAYAQIAEVLGASVPQVKTWLHRGRRQLAAMLQEFMAPERPKPTLAPAPARGEGRRPQEAAARPQRPEDQEARAAREEPAEAEPAPQPFGMPALDLP